MSKQELNELIEKLIAIRDCEGRVNHWSEVGEIVRCKDCRHNPDGYENGSVPKTRCPLWCGWCFNIDVPKPDFFCAYGEWK